MHSFFIVSFRALSEIKLTQKDLFFQIYERCQLESDYTTVCNCILSVGEVAFLWIYQLLNATSVVAAGNFKLRNQCQTNTALPSDA